MILPAIAFVLAAGLGLVHLGAVQVQLADAAADAARIIGRGDPPGDAAARVSHAHPGASMGVSNRGALVCVTATADPQMGVLGAFLHLEGTGCALDDRAGAS